MKLMCYFVKVWTPQFIVVIISIGKCECNLVWMRCIDKLLAYRNKVFW